MAHEARGNLHAWPVWRVRFQLKSGVQPIEESVLAETALVAIQLAARWHNADPQTVGVLNGSHAVAVIQEGTVVIEE